MSVQLIKITEPMALGEGPHWDSKQQVLYFVDIMNKTINKYLPATGTVTSAKLDGRVGFIVPVEGTSDQFVVGVELKFLVVQWDGKDGSDVKVVRQLAEVDSYITPNNRINDGKADPHGRLYAGTMGYEEKLGYAAPGKGSLFRLIGDEITTLADQVGISNGLAWDLEEKAFYYTDSMEGNIRRYDYDVETGHISNKTYIFDLKKNGINGAPDGTTIDTDGNLWVAVFGGSCVIKINPRTGQLLDKVMIPASQVTSVAFGGPDLDVLFVTTASLTIDDVEHKPPSGSIYMVTGLEVEGFPSDNFKLQ